MDIQIFSVGGTIDKIYFDENSEFAVGDPQILELLDEANVTFDFHVTSLMRKDSMQMTDADRMLIREACETCAHDRILITHGTDTMAQTGRALDGIAGKVIVLTGAMQPARFRVSDAIFNIGYAIAALQLLGEGVYVAMNGQVFPPDHLRKNREKLRFEQSDTA